MRGDGHFDEEVAAWYDQDHGDTGAETIEATVSMLADLAGAGPALEFAIGTGRVALPLAGRGIEVRGIELSRPMVARLREKEGGAAIDVTIGDMTTTRVDGAFSLVYLVFNTISNLTSQDAQIACFRNAAAHLRPGGCFLVENAVPPLRRLPQGVTRLAFARSEHHWGIDDIDVATQQCVSHHVWIDGGQARRLSLPFRYAWPSELDLMARLAGLELRERWGHWHRGSFTGLSDRHVSIWRKTKD